MIDLINFVTEDDIENAEHRVRMIQGRTSSYTNDKRLSLEEKQKNYDMYNGIVDVNDIVTSCAGLSKDVALPAKVRHLDIVRSKVNVLIGEQIKRPYRCTVQGMSSNITSTKYDNKKKAIIEGLMLDLQATAAKVGMSEPPEQAPPSIEALNNISYEDKRETLAAKIRKIERQRLGIEDLALEGWTNALIVAEEFYHVGEKQGKPFVRVVNPNNIEYEITAGIKDIKYAEYVRERRIMMPYTILEEFGEYMTDEEIESVEKFNKFYYPTGKPNEIYAMNAPLFSDEYGSTVFEEGLQVTYNEWRQAITIKVLTYLDNEGVEIKELIPANFKIPRKLKGRCTIKKYKKVIAWEGVLIGVNIIVRVRPIPNQITNISDLTKDCELNYVGRVYSNLNSRATSIVEVLKPIQLLVNGLNYKLELELMKSDTGKKLLMDVTQLPRVGDTALTLEEWLAYISLNNVIFVNPSQEGNNADGKPSGFNQFKEIDLSLSSSIGQFINVIQFLMTTAATTSGISPQRESTVGSNELVGNVNRAVTQSAHITEMLFKVHEEIQRQLDEKLIKKAKALYKENETLQYINDEGEIALLKYDADLLNDGDYGVFVVTSSKEIDILGKTQDDIERALQSNLITMAEAIRIRKADNVADILSFLERKEKERQMQQQREQQQQQDTAKHVEELRLKATQEEAAIRREELALSKENNIRDNETKLTIAKMSVDKKDKNNLDTTKNSGNVADKETYQDRLIKDAQYKKILADIEAIANKPKLA